MIDELLKDIEDLKEYKYKFECQKKDKEKMSQLIYELMMEKYNNMSFEERVKDYKKRWCSCCKHGTIPPSQCFVDLPEDIDKPIPSDKAWIPTKKSCGNFEWS